MVVLLTVKSNFVTLKMAAFNASHLKNVLRPSTIVILLPLPTFKYLSSAPCFCQQTSLCWDTVFRFKGRKKAQFA